MQHCPSKSYGWCNTTGVIRVNNKYSTEPYHLLSCYARWCQDQDPRVKIGGPRSILHRAQEVT